MTKILFKLEMMLNATTTEQTNNYIVQSLSITVGVTPVQVETDISLCLYFCRPLICEWCFEFPDRGMSVNGPQTVHSWGARKVMAGRHISMVILITWQQVPKLPSTSSTIKV